MNEITKRIAENLLIASSGKPPKIKTAPPRSLDAKG